MDLHSFVRRHKKLLTYSGLGAAAYFFVWPLIADAITQARGSIATPPGAPPEPAFVPVYLTSSAPPAPYTGIPGSSSVFQYYNPTTGNTVTSNAPIPTPSGYQGLITNPGGQFSLAPVGTATATPGVTAVGSVGTANLATPHQSLSVVPSVLVTHSIYSEWDVNDPAQQWNPASPVPPPTGRKDIPSSWRGHSFVGGVM